MSKRTRSHEAILAEVTRSSERSPLFWWLVEHHDELIAQSAGRRMSWKALCPLFAGHGLTDINGRPPFPRMARETWFQARKAVSQAKARKAQAEAEAKARPGSTYPSRISPDWRPQPVQPPPPTRPPMPATAPVPAGTPPPSSDGIVISPEAQAKIDRVLERMTAEDRRKFRFGG